MYGQGIKSQQRSVLLWPTRDYWVNPYTGQVHFEGCSHPPEKYESYLGRHISLGHASRYAQGMGYDADPCYWCSQRERRMKRKGLMEPIRKMLRPSERIRRRFRPIWL